MRSTWAAVGIAVVAALSATNPANAARDGEGVEPESTRTYNDGEQGYLDVTIPVLLPGPGPQVPGKITGGCEFTTTGVPNTSETIVSVLAHATSTATSAGYPVATGVTCEVTNVHGGVAIDRAAPLTTVAYPGAAQVRYGNFTICLTVSALYDTNDFVSSKQVCARP